MAGEVKPEKVKFRQVEEGDEAFEVLAAQRQHYEHLALAVIALLWRDNYSTDAEGNESWGDTKVIPEEHMRLSAEPNPAELLVILNASLWNRSDAAQRAFLMDQRLAPIAAKLDSNGDQKQQEGPGDEPERELWLVRKTPFMGFPEPLKRHGAVFKSVKVFLAAAGATLQGSLDFDAPPPASGVPATDEQPVAH